MALFSALRAVIRAGAVNLIISTTYLTLVGVIKDQLKGRYQRGEQD